MRCSEAAYDDATSSFRGDTAMSESRHGRRSRHQRRRDRRPRDEEREPEYQEIDDALLSPSERALREARRIADRKVKLTGQLVRFGLIAIPLLIFIPPVGLIVLIFWGSGHLKELYRLFLEPRLRERYMREEVQKQVHAHLSHERQTLEGEHARSMHELSASIAHEIRNPITAAKSLVQQMEEEPSAAENVEYARVALEELGRVERSVSHLLRFARDEEMRVVPVRLSEVIESALETFRDRLQRSGVTLVKQLDCVGELRGDAEQLRRVIINLVGNAIDALDERGSPAGRIEVQMGENLAGNAVWLRIADDGPGIEESVRSRMFSPFYTSKASGTGLGLPICKKLVEAHGGTIEVKSEPGIGAEFVLSFPKSPGAAGHTS
jgi:signal transduction histidine kinase